MALRIKNGKVISIQPPRNLTKKQIELLENAPKSENLLKQAQTIKFNIVYK